MVFQPMRPCDVSGIYEVYWKTGAMTILPALDLSALCIELPGSEVGSCRGKRVPLPAGAEPGSHGTYTDQL